MNKFLITAALLAATALTGVAEANAANINVQKMENTTVIMITGPIEPLDGVKFMAATKNVSGNAIVALQSPGGAVIAGLTIGYIVKTKSWSTLVMKDNTCASACADIWLAGSSRIVQSGAFIGMHSESQKVAVRVGKGKTVTETVRGDNSERIAYFSRLGLSREAIIAMLTPNPDSMMWLTVEKGAALGITFKVIN